MNKVTDFLEKNVEWLALGLGGVFLLWMVWTYVVNPPVTVKLGGEELSLSEVDRHILRGKAQDLDARIKDPTPVDLRFPNVAQRFAEAITNKGLPPAPQLTEYAINFRGVQAQDVGPGPDPNEIKQQVFVNALVDLAAPIPAIKPAEAGGKPTHQISKGVSQALVPAAVAAQPGAPGAPPPVINVNQLNDNAAQRDVLWVTLKYVAPMKPLHDELVKKNYFQALNNQIATQFVTVEVEREELVGPNQWGNATKVERLPVINDIPPIPDGKDPQAAQQFLQWAETNTVYILKPPFYPTVAGVTWTEPGYEPPPAVTDAPPAETPEEIRRRLKEEADRKKAEALERRANRPDRSGGDEERPRRSRRDREDPALRDDERPGSQFDRRLPNPQVMPDDYRRRPGQTIPPGGGRPPELFEGGLEQVPGQPPQPGQAVVPQEVVGKFAPSPTTPDVDFWVHDATVQAGKTYRYRVRYKMLNPIYNLLNVAKPASLQQVFLLESPWSEWSDPVAMDSLAQFFVAGGAPRPDSATFEIYKWENGGWQHARFDNVRPGDAIGGKKMVNGKEVDFATGTTLVDIRDQGPRNERVVVLVDAQGGLATRDFRTDQNDPARKELQRKADEERQRLARPGEAPAAGVR